MTQTQSQPEHNIAFIDGQNLHFGTSTEGWKIDFARFRVYLAKKLHVCKAYYFLGFLDDNEHDLYTKLQEAGFIVAFREHNTNMKGKFKKVLFPNSKFSSLYKQIHTQYRFTISTPDIKKKIEYKKRDKCS